MCIVTQFQSSWEYVVILRSDVSLFNLGPDTKVMQNSGKSTF